MTVSRGDDGRALIHCHHVEQCGFRDVLAALNISPSRPTPRSSSAVFPTTGAAAKKPRKVHESAKQAAEAAKWIFRPGDDPEWKPDGVKIAANWKYQNESGDVFMVVVRFLLPDGLKAYTQVHRVDGGWSVGMPSGLRRLYRLPDVLEADLVFVTEGEKAADAIAGLGLVATTTPGGAGAPHKADLSPLMGKDVVLLPDHDDEGRAYASKMTELLKEVGARSIKTVELPGLPQKGDACEWLADGVPDSWTPEDCRAELERLASQSDEPTASPQAPAFEWKTRPLGAPTVEAGRFPIEAFPPPIRDLARELAESMTTAVDIVGVSVLAVAASAIGQSVNIGLNRTWFEAAQFYVAQVGPPGKKKSPPLKWLVRPLAEIDHEQLEVYRKEYEAWDRGDPKARPAQPVRRRTIVSDITTESIAVVHAENPRGLLVHRDELAGWLGSFDQYRAKGSDRQFWLSNASCMPIQVDRKGGRESLYVASPLIGVIGGLTPDNLALLVKDDASGRGGEQVDDGFLDRMIFAFPDHYPPQQWTDADVSSESEHLWCSVVRTLHGRGTTREQDRDRPWLVQFTPAAKSAWVEWHDHHMAEAEGGFSELNEFPECPPSGRLGGIWSKYRAVCARVALVLSRLRAAVEAEDPYGPPCPVSEEDVRNAILLTEYFKRTARKVLASTKAGQVKLADDEKACIEWLLRSKSQNTFTSNDLNSSLGRFRGSPERLKATLDSLIKLGCIRPLPLPPPTGKPGRPPSPSFEANPHLRSGYSFNSGNPTGA